MGRVSAGLLAARIVWAGRIAANSFFFAVRVRV